MVAVITSGYSIQRMLNYNEKKVNAGVAACIGAGNYPADPQQMNFNMKLGRFKKQMALNESVQRNAVHISLNFDVSETSLTQEKLMSIAEAYLDKLGFGKQPYLVYQHYDAGHPHIHLVTTNIQDSGRRIAMHHLAIRKSEPARKATEQQFNLVQAEKQAKPKAFRLDPITATQVTYGKTQTKRAIQQVLDLVIDQYKFTSLPELNAILKQYNISAERGNEDSRVFKHQGLLYRILDDSGKPIGVPIKASNFYSNPVRKSKVAPLTSGIAKAQPSKAIDYYYSPTLKALEQKFRDNEIKRIPNKTRIKNAIDLALKTGNQSLEALSKNLAKQGIVLVPRQNEAGKVYGITYIDHKSKCVINGSALGKNYSAKQIQERLQVNKKENTSPALIPKTLIKTDFKDIAAATQPADLLATLFSPETEADAVPFAFRQKKKRKKRRPNQS